MTISLLFNRGLELPEVERLRFAPGVPFQDLPFCSPP